MTKCFSKSIDSGKYLLDWMFLRNEPTPEMTILMNPKISLTPYWSATGSSSG
jgi:D-3-phosphoglycerate dehydrogenase